MSGPALLSISVLSLDDVIKYTGHSRRSFYLAIKAGKYPQPRKRGTRSLWVASEIEAALEAELASMPFVQDDGRRKSSVTRARAAA